MTTKCSRVLVIGAGVSGIAATKSCLDESLDVVCVERTGSIGGLWNYTSEATEGQACVNKSTVINTSKEMTAFSDFPMAAEYANYMHNTKLMEYFQSYLEHFGVDKKIKFNTEVVHLKRSEDFDSTGRWDVTLKDLKTGEESEDTFDAVLVCTGHHADKNMPEFKGQGTFTGKIIHSHDYRDQRGFEDKKVIVVGIGNSGVDIAVELGRVASQTYLSTRRGAWIFKRVFTDGLPIDTVRTTRLFQMIQNCLPTSIVEYIAQKQLNFYMDHERYRLKPKHGVTQAHPTVNDDLANRIACGSVKVKADIERIHGSTVYFTDGSEEQNIDVIFVCTGYKFGFPFIEPGIVDVKDNVSDLYLYMFPPHLTRTTLAVIGYIQPLGSIMPISELQTRVATRVFKSLNKLPSKHMMVSNIREKRAIMQKRYVSSTRHTIQVDYIKYMDELAEVINVKPNIWELAKSDPKLAWQCFFGPCSPYQFRINGPGSWKGARDAIMTQWDRIEKATHTRPLESTSCCFPTCTIIGAVLIILFALVLTLIL